MLSALLYHSGAGVTPTPFPRAVGEGIVPNTFTVDQLMRSCNFKRQGHWERAMSAVAKLQEQGELPATLVDSLLDVSAAAMHRAARSAAHPPPPFFVHSHPSWS